MYDDDVNDPLIGREMLWKISTRKRSANKSELIFFGPRITKSLFFSFRLSAGIQCNFIIRDVVVCL